MVPRRMHRYWYLDFRVVQSTDMFPHDGLPMGLPFPLFYLHIPQLLLTPCSSTLSLKESLRVHKLCMYPSVQSPSIRRHPLCLVLAGHSWYFARCWQQWVLPWGSVSHQQPARVSTAAPFVVSRSPPASWQNHSHEHNLKDTMTIKKKKRNKKVALHHGLFAMAKASLRGINSTWNSSL